jgi:dipeptidyl aminopeptidase/acylaminoacyl peptidase
LADIAAVQDFLINRGTLRAGRTAVCGQSWGGYLALLAAGVQPERWQAVAAANPIADYVAAFSQSTPAVRQLDIALFNGTPEEVPESYARSSPASYLPLVRGPVLLVAGTDDPKCPPGQVQAYADRLRQLGIEMELRWTKSGHEGYEVDVLVETLGTVVGFVATALGGRPAPTASGAR